MYPPVPPSFESASGNHLNEKEANYCKVYANRCDHQKLQRAIDNQSSISEAENSIEPRPSLSCSFRGKNLKVFPHYLQPGRFIRESPCCWFLSC